MTGGWAVVDAVADPQVVGSHVRALIVEGIGDLCARDREVSAATLRPWLEERGVSRDQMDKRMPAQLSQMRQKGIIRWTGRAVASGNRAQRNADRLVKVFRMHDWDSYYAYKARYLPGGDLA